MDLAHESSLIGRNDLSDAQKKPTSIHGITSSLWSGNTIFMMAVLYKNIDLAQRIFSKNPHINLDQENASGRSALLMAIEHKDASMLLFLIQSGATVNTRFFLHNPSPENQEYAKNAFMWAAQKSSLEVVQLLVQAGADLKADTQGQPVLEVAVKLAEAASNMEVASWLKGYQIALQEQELLKKSTGQDSQQVQCAKWPNQGSKNTEPLTQRAKNRAKAVL